MIENCPVNIEHFVKRLSYKDWSIPSRYIYNNELVFIIDGTGEVVMGEEKYKVKQGDVFYITPKIKHSLRATEAPFMEFFAVHFTLENSLEKLPLNNLLHVPNFYKISEQLKLLETYYFQDEISPIHKWKLNLLLQQIIFELIETSLKKDSPTNKKRMEMLVKFIEENLDKELNLKILTEHAKIEKSYLTNLFKENMGQTPMRYITLRRINKAKNLLRDEKKHSIEFISSECGFSDMFYFSKCFKKETGMTPSKYRKFGWL